MNFVVADDTRQLRRAVGVTAWIVLEELLLDGTRDERGGVVAATSVRRVAAQLGVSKDTAARAVVRLVDAGVVHRVEGGRGERGRFASAAYVIDIMRLDGITVTPPVDRDVVLDHAPPPSRRSTRTTTINDEQTSLFDLTDANRS